MSDFFKNLWFRDPKESATYINEVAMRMRAGILLFIPLYMGLTLFDVVYTSSWVVDGNTAVDTYDTDWDGNILYTVEAVKRTYEYSIQTALLLYGLFEMIAGMFVFSSRFSPTIILCTYLARNTPPVWKPLVPKRVAWSIGATLMTICIMFFNPDTFASWLNNLWGSQLLSETENFIPYWMPVYLVWVCIGFMWLEAIFGYCVGCKLHALLVWMGIFKEECLDCNNIDWDEIARKHEAKQAVKDANTPD
jgi:hypothetical protein